MLLRTVVLVGLFTALTGCAPGGPSSQPPGDGAVVDATGAWQMSSGVVDGAPFPVDPEAPITMTVKGSEIGGRSACNHYGAEIVVENGQIRMRPTSMTQMACPEPAMAAEAAFHAVLGRITGASRVGDRLTFTGPDVELAFDRLPPVPVAGMVGTDWVLESLISGDAVSSVAGAPATLRLDADGTFSGSTGCRTFKGRWIEANGGISHSNLAMQGECPPDLSDQDGHVVGVLEGFRVSIDGQVMTLTGERGEGLGYRAVRPSQ
jgi:heat shock protein HslJ